MCSVFGLIDYKNKLSVKQKNKIISVLSKECEIRGTDATGIAYNHNNQLKVYKRPIPAHKMRFNIPNKVSVIMGHTRMTTQGNAKFNYNNHPFTGTVQDNNFAFAHNGVLFNDIELRFTENLPKTNIKTDSYVAVQLLEKCNTLDFNSIRYMSESVEGSFVFTILDRQDNIWFVHGNNPLTIYQYNGFYIYASTSEILQATIKKLGINTPTNVITSIEGDILKINHLGKITYGKFTPQHSISHMWRYVPYYDFDEQTDKYSYLIDIAKSMGFSEDEIIALLDYGCTAYEIEELLYQPDLLHQAASELLYAY